MQCLSAISPLCCITSPAADQVVQPSAPQTPCSHFHSLPSGTATSVETAGRSSSPPFHSATLVNGTGAMLPFPCRDILDLQVKMPPPKCHYQLWEPRAVIWATNDGSLFLLKVHKEVVRKGLEASNKYYLHKMVFSCAHISIYRSEAKFWPVGFYTSWLIIYLKAN